MNRRAISRHKVAQRSPRLGAENNFMPFTINISKDIGERARLLAFEEHVSESSFFEVALRLFLNCRSNAEVAETLRQNGATLRRPPGLASAPQP